MSRPPSPVTIQQTTDNIPAMVLGLHFSLTTSSSQRVWKVTISTRDMMKRMGSMVHRFMSFSWTSVMYTDTWKEGG